MATFVAADWVEERLYTPGFLVVDPRSAMRYLQGHLQSAVNLPLQKFHDADGRLLSDVQLAELLGSMGLGDHQSPVLYDGPDGRNAAMLAWVLEYLGRQDVHIMDVLLAGWVAQGRELFYRPVKPVAAQFTARVNPVLRASLADVSAASGVKLVDLRSREEYAGETDIDSRPGHIPGAVNIVWQELVGQDGRFLCPDEKVRQALDHAAIGRDDRIVAYCRTGVRAAVGYLGFRRLGYDVRLYDGSYAEWEKSGMPVETAATQH